MNSQNYFVYIFTNDDRHTVLYIGATNNLEQRASDHSLGRGSAFVRQYNAHKLVLHRDFFRSRERHRPGKQLKRWNRAKKETLIVKANPEWRDLFEEMHALKGK
jgi:putative endonuclease